MKDTEETVCAGSLEGQNAGVQNSKTFGQTNDKGDQALERETEAEPESSCCIPSLCGQAITGCVAFARHCSTQLNELPKQDRPSPKKRERAFSSRRRLHSCLTPKLLGKNR